MRRPTKFVVVKLPIFRPRELHRHRILGMWALKVAARNALRRARKAVPLGA